MRVMISQPRYLPAVNYLHRIIQSDIYVVLNDVQRQGRGLENRNKVIIRGEPSWLTIPIESSSRELICKTLVSNLDWLQQHQDLIATQYEKAPFFDLELLRSLYKMPDQGSLSFQEITTQLLKNILNIFDKDKKILLSSDLLDTEEQKILGPSKLLRICEKLDAKQYISGPNGLEYGVREAFERSSVAVKFHKNILPEYAHFNKNIFVPFLAYIDVIFNLGTEDLNHFFQSKLEFIKYE